MAIFKLLLRPNSRIRKHADPGQTSYPALLVYHLLIFFVSGSSFIMAALSRLQQRIKENFQVGADIPTESS